MGASAKRAGAEAGLDVRLHGNPDKWVLVCKASSEIEGWVKSTKAMVIEDSGVLVQVTSQQGGQRAEALAYIPGAEIKKDGEFYKIVGPQPRKA